MWSTWKVSMAFWDGVFGVRIGRPGKVQYQDGYDMI